MLKTNIHIQKGIKKEEEEEGETEGLVSLVQPYGFFMV